LITILETQRGHRFLELDAVRGVAAVAVILGHFNQALAHRTLSRDIAFHLLGSGHAAVIFFFLLSGFVLTSMYLGPTRTTYSSFLIKRICRIYLPYVVAILLAAGFSARLYSPIPVDNFWIDQTWNSKFSSHLLIQHLIMIGHFDSMQLNTAIWSLVIEMRVSLVFPLIAWIAARARPLPIILSFVPVTFGLAWLADHGGHLMTCDTLFYSMIFLFGSLLRRHYDHIRARLSAFGLTQTSLLLALGCVGYQFAEFLPLSHIESSPALRGYIIESILCASATILLLLATTSGRLRHLLHHRIVMWAGTRSYSIYLLHGTVLFTIIRLVGGRGIPIGYLFAFVPITFLLAEAMYRWVETPSIILGRRLGNRKTAIVVDRVPLQVPN
jgi:peptidoglycan/LPS O-acetylase OafA/YrhL